MHCHVYVCIIFLIVACKTYILSDLCCTYFYFRCLIIFAAVAILGEFVASITLAKYIVILLQL